VEKPSYPAALDEDNQETTDRETGCLTGDIFLLSSKVCVYKYRPPHELAVLNAAKHSGGLGVTERPVTGSTTGGGCRVA
jgi:hypothetical protein